MLLGSPSPKQMTYGSTNAVKNPNERNELFLPSESETYSLTSVVWFPNKWLLWAVSL